MPEVDGMQVLESAKPFKPQTEFIILTAVDDIPTTVKAIRQGAYDYLVKPRVKLQHLFTARMKKAGDIRIRIRFPYSADERRGKKRISDPVNIYYQYPFHGCS